jgi:hypothetical protein
MLQKAKGMAYAVNLFEGNEYKTMKSSETFIGVGVKVATIQLS